MSSGPDLFQYYIRSVCELLSSVDNFSPSSSRLVASGSGSFRERDNNEKSRSAGFSGLFCNAVGDKLQGHDKTRLMAMLHQCVVSLNQEVDEMVDPVLAMHRLRDLLAPTKIHVGNQEAQGEIENETRARKRLKVSNLTEESEYGDCLKQTKETPYYKDENGSCFRPRSRNNKETEEVNEDLKVLLVNKGSVAEKMEKHSAEYSATLERMEEKLEELIDMVVATCRPMTLAEKHELRRLILGLPPQNLDRVAEIIQRRKPPEQQSTGDIPVDLQKEDDLTLWRLYFYVKAVENAQKLL